MAEKDEDVILIGSDDDEPAKNGQNGEPANPQADSEAKQRNGQGNVRKRRVNSHHFEEICVPPKRIPVSDYCFCFCHVFLNQMQNEARQVDIDLTLGDDVEVSASAAGSASKKRYVPYLPPSRPHIQPKPDVDAQFRGQLGSINPANPGPQIPGNMQGFPLNYLPGIHPQQPPALRAPLVQQQQQPMMPMMPANQGASLLQASMSQLANAFKPGVAQAWNAIQQYLPGGANPVKFDDCLTGKCDSRV